MRDRIGWVTPRRHSLSAFSCRGMDLPPLRSKGSGCLLGSFSLSLSFWLSLSLSLSPPSPSPLLTVFRGERRVERTVHGMKRSAVQFLKCCAVHCTEHLYP
jgi:hypothetical protein